MEQSDHKKQKITQLQTIYRIVNSTFINNRANSSHGGAIYFDNLFTASLQNVHFVSNLAVNGGGFYLSCLQPYNCSLQMIGIQNFTGNYAKKSGGAYYWGDIQPRLTDIKQIFMNNVAEVYGDNIGTFA